MTYDPDWDGPTATESFSALDAISRVTDRRIVSPHGQIVTVRWKAGGPHRLFERCDIAESVKDSLVSNCTFSECRFRGSRWDNVKFSNCLFSRCDLSDVVFARCHFVSDCRFEHNSASAELFRIEETAISASAFVNALETNLKHASNPPYQEHRFVGTREKLAKALFSATRNVADVDYYFEAYEQLMRCTLAQRVEQHRFKGIQVRARRIFIARSLPARVER